MEKRTKIAVTIVVVVACIIGLLAVVAFIADRTHENSEEPTSSSIALNEDHMYIRPFGGIEEDTVYGDAEAARAQLLQICESCPEVLATTASAFRGDLPDFGIPSELDDFNYIRALDAKFDEPDGEKCIKELTASLTALLEHEDTVIEFTKDSEGFFDTVYLCARDVREQINSQNLCLVKVPTYLNGQEILKISTRIRKGEARTTSYFLIQGGFQRIMDMSYAP